MTAEVAVMNRTGVALAADSAVTVGGRASRKIYTSAEKLFQLSEIAPVGIMVYGNAGYVSLPWETIIKAYRRQLGTKTFPTVEEYASNFVTFLTDNKKLFPDEARRHAMGQLLEFYFTQLRMECREAYRAMSKKKKAPLTDDETKAAHGDAIHAAEQAASQEPLIEGMDEPFRQQVRQEMVNVVPALMKKCLAIPLPDDIEERLRGLSLEVLTRQVWGNLFGGVVIGGFGEDEYLPSIAAFEVEESVAGKPRKTETRQERLTHGPVMARILPFAQQDSVVHFLLGVDSDLFDFMSESVKNMARGVVDLVMDKATESCSDVAKMSRDPIQEEVRTTLKELFESWQAQQSNYFIPVMSTIAVLPKDELASIAEAFVNLTKFRGRVTPAPETVSGPIDVAVITKGDGFVWIRRKHYFDPDRNPRIMARFHNPGGMS